ncbi:FecR family protein [Woodsholea maritima]|uniref:FecR family protein n=1 Tax=Woodsholea maritima TaxID=240237 RepID=UPI0003710F12|nr:FecR domain-containing protein [Woodsholea maritima]
MHTEEMTARDVHDHAAQWVFKIEAGLSAAEQAAFEAWIGADPAHVEIFARQSAILAADGAALQAEEGLDAPLAGDAVYYGEDSPVRGPSPWHVAFMGVMSLVIVAVLGGVGWTMLSSSDLPLPPSVSGQIYQTASADIRSQVLEDGSTLWVDAQSQVRVDYRVEERTLYLEDGAVFIEVTPNPERPLRVQAGEVSFTALGTAYEVEAREGAYTLRVDHGVVAIQDRAHGFEAVLEAGEEAHWSAATGWQHGQINRWGAALWRQERIAFENVSLGEVLTVVNRYREHPIVVVDKALSEEQISGVFALNFNDPETLVTALSASAGAKARTLYDGRVLLMPEAA